MIGCRCSSLLLSAALLVICDGIVTSVEALNTEEVYNPCKGNEFYPDPDDCTKFYHCNGALAYHKDCPPTTEWDETNNRCESPSIAQCSSKRSVKSKVHDLPTPEMLDVLPTDCPYNPCNGDLYYPDPNDCSKYYSCDGTNAEHWSCPPDNEFDVASNTCLPPGIAKCGTRGEITQSPSITTTSSESAETIQPAVSSLTKREGYETTLVSGPSTDVITHDVNTGASDEPSTEATTSETDDAGECTDTTEKTTTDEGSGSEETTEPPSETTTDEGSGSWETTESSSETTTDEGSGSWETTESSSETTTDEGSGSWETTEPRSETTTDEGSGSEETTEPPSETTTDEGSGSWETTESSSETTTDEGSGGWETTEPPSETTTDEGSGSEETTEPSSETTTKSSMKTTTGHSSGGSSTMEPISHPCNPCKGEEFYPFPDDCNKYYKCDGIYPYLKDCPEGLEWNHKQQMCDWPEFAACITFGGKRITN